jgi:hypothetical protein
MTNVHAYSCRTQHDVGSPDLTDIIKDSCTPYLKRLGPFEWQGTTLDGWPALGKDLWTRPAAKDLYDRLKTEDVVMFYGIERCFLSARNLFKIAQGLEDMNIKVILLDLGLTLGTPASNALFECTRRILDLPKLVSAATREPVKV